MTPTEITEAKARLVSLKRARDSGVLRVEHQGTSTTYRSLEELRSIIVDLSDEIAEAEGTSARGPSYVRQTNKGL